MRRLELRTYGYLWLMLLYRKSHHNTEVIIFQLKIKKKENILPRLHDQHVIELGF